MSFQKQEFIDVFQDVMQEMAFVDVIVEHDKTMDDMNDVVIFNIAILLPYQGEVFLIFSRDLVNEMIHNILGEHSDENAESIFNDSVAEFLNVLVGRYYDHVNPELLFELGIPKLIPELDPSQISKHEKVEFLSAEGHLGMLAFPGT